VGRAGEAQSNNAESEQKRMGGQTIAVDSGEREKENGKIGRELRATSTFRRGTTPPISAILAQGQNWPPTAGQLVEQAVASSSLGSQGKGR
jgi:hypothetical protein